jgi:hypothetical protein
MGQCPICATTGAEQLPPIPPPGNSDSIGWDCPRCGQFYLAGSAAAVLPPLLDREEINASRLSHVLRIHFDESKKPRRWSEEDLALFKQDPTYVRPQQQFDNLILWIGKNQGAAHQWAAASYASLAARIGAAITHGRGDEPGLEWVCQSFGGELFSRQYAGSGQPLIEYRLKAGGWKYFEELSRRTVDSRNAFMAMKFNEPQLEYMMARCFQPAAVRAGFNLQPLNQLPAAGLIDNQIRAAIRAARFVVADLTHGNHGAYFEAGFAEGLGLPVIYTCRKDVFESPSKEDRPHFDTNHMHTVVWEYSSLEAAGNLLTATIRNTLPAASKLDD